MDDMRIEENICLKMEEGNKKNYRDAKKHVTLNLLNKYIEL